MADMQGKVQAISLTPGLLPSSVVDQVEVTWEGLVGDKHFGLTMKAGSSQKPYAKGVEVRNVRQVSIVSAEELKQVAENMDLPGIQPTWVGGNLMLSGIPGLTQLPSGSRLYFENGVGIVVEGENMPCTTAGGCLQQQYPNQPDLTSAFPKKAIGKRGLVAWVEKPGTIRKGESVIVRLAQDVKN
jgi:MOSC domain-containing protein YiiM